MGSTIRDRFNKPGESVDVGLALVHSAALGTAKGEVFIRMDDADGVLHESRHDNVITLDAGIQAARYFKDPNEPANGANMLAVGTGATGAILTPDAPDSRQRKLNAEIERKAWSSTTFRDASGNAVAIPTNIVDFTVVYDEAEAVGPLNEMGILSTVSDNPLIKNDNPNVYPTRDVTVDVSSLDVLINYLTFGVITKPSTARLTITWRITF